MALKSIMRILSSDGTRNGKITKYRSTIILKIAQAGEFFRIETINPPLRKTAARRRSRPRHT